MEEDIADEDKDCSLGEGNELLWHDTRKLIEIPWSLESILSAECNLVNSGETICELKIGLEVHETTPILNLSRVAVWADGSGDGAWSWRATT